MASADIVSVPADHTTPVVDPPFLVRARLSDAQFRDLVAVLASIFKPQVFSDDGEMRLWFAPCTARMVDANTVLTLVTLRRGEKCPELLRLLGDSDYAALGVRLTEQNMRDIERVCGRRPESSFFDLCGCDQTFASQPWYSDRRQHALVTMSADYSSDMDMDEEDRTTYRAEKARLAQERAARFQGLFQAAHSTTPDEEAMSDDDDEDEQPMQNDSADNGNDTQRTLPSLFNTITTTNVHSFFEQAGCNRRVFFKDFVDELMHDARVSFPHDQTYVAFLRDAMASF